MFTASKNASSAPQALPDPVFLPPLAGGAGLPPLVSGQQGEAPAGGHPRLRLPAFLAGKRAPAGRLLPAPKGLP